MKFIVDDGNGGGFGYSFLQKMKNLATHFTASCGEELTLAVQMFDLAGSRVAVDKDPSS